MFGLFSSVEKQMRTTAQHWLELGEKVYAYRRDLLSEADRTDLNQKLAALRALRKERADASRLKLGTEALEEVLRRTGGKFYPRSSLQEYVEFFVVAAIVILGIRAYFVQPFKIPTNSMWPTYNGMTAEVYKAGEADPGPVEKAVRFALFGAIHTTVTAEVAGPVYVPVYAGNGRLDFDEKPGRKWYVFPTSVREYTFRVGDHQQKLQVPIDFDFDSAIWQAYDTSPERLAKAAQEAGGGRNAPVWIKMPGQANVGQRVISFDIMTGDQLFVERLSYHFFQPKVGQGFVFRTGNIPGIGSDQYYIKRLVGIPGDTLEIKEPVLFRNGQPIAGAGAFEANAKRLGLYKGYVWRGQYMPPRSSLTIPEKSYFAMGDNSTNSLDSRYWGYVPYKDVVGRPLFIYYPFTKRFGGAK